jgi:predicted acylesterase/phospholipase RssA
MGKRFRILSLDGGGIKGTFTAAVLAEFERVTGKRVVEHFDLIAGTSTGGILAIGLGLGLPAAEILRFYRDRGPVIFPATGLLGRPYGFFVRLFRPKRDQSVLRDQLGQVLGSRTLGESKCRLVIPAFDATYGRVFIFKTAHHPRFLFDTGLLAADVATATAAAPTYYEAYQVLGHGGRFIDGGVWANCPVHVAVTEAVTFLGQSPADIDVLSIGTTSYPYLIDERTQRGGLIAWGGGAAIETMFRAQEEIARAHSALLVGRKNIHRVNYDAPPGEFRLDDATGIAKLERIGTDTARLDQHLTVIQATFLNDVSAEPFHPFTATPAVGGQAGAVQSARPDCNEDAPGGNSSRS